MAKWQSYKRFRIVDTISREYVDTIDATNGKVAMQKFRHRMMNTGIYEIRKMGNEWHMLSSYGSHFKAELMCGIGGEVVQKNRKTERLYGCQWHLWRSQLCWRKCEGCKGTIYSYVH